MTYITYLLEELGGSDIENYYRDLPVGVIEDFGWVGTRKDLTLAVDPAFPWPGGDVDNPGGNGGGDTIYRLREGIERFMITDINNPGASAMAQSELPVSWDYQRFSPGDDRGAPVSDFNHVPGGSNVLYMDGHVEFAKYPSQYRPAPLSIIGPII